MGLAGAKAQNCNGRENAQAGPQRCHSDGKRHWISKDEPVVTHKPLPVQLLRDGTGGRPLPHDPFGLCAPLPGDAALQTDSRRAARQAAKPRRSKGPRALEREVAGDPNSMKVRHNFAQN
jgi:hypothetical protein